VSADWRFELDTRRTVFVDGESNSGPGLEVIVRVKDENGATVATDEFLRVAERFHLSSQVDRWVVQTALEALGRGAVQLPEGRSLIIPLSGESLGYAAFVDFLVDCLDNTGVAPDGVCFELTVHSVASNREYARRFIGVLHTMGCRFVLGDFGLRGHMLPNLRHLAFDYLRIDSELLRDVAADRVSRTMFDALIEFGRALGLRIIASQVDPPSASEDVVAVAIDWEMGGETLLQLEVDADGSIRRAGDGTPSVASQSRATGRSDELLLARILAGMDSELLGIGGLRRLEPFAGKLGKLSVHFRGRDGGGRAFEVWYGSASAGPSAAIMEFVANAIRVTDAWYARMRPEAPRT
jgi:EAL domain-containing protein (putative c-di-GMP-specific phosphodiesterase class I)